MSCLCWVPTMFKQYYYKTFAPIACWWYFRGGFFLNTNYLFRIPAELKKKLFIIIWGKRKRQFDMGRHKLESYVTRWKQTYKKFVRICTMSKTYSNSSECVSGSNAFFTGFFVHEQRLVGQKRISYEPNSN